MNSGRTINWGSIISFTLIGLALLALVVLGVIWSKNRSNSYAQKDNSGQQQAPAEQPQAQGEQNPQEDQAGRDQQVAGESSQQTPTTGVQQVPATGAGSLAATLGAIALTTFAGAHYWASRRRLANC